MTNIDQIKCEEFASDKEKCFREHKVVNFEVIHHECRGDVLKKTFKEHKTVSAKDFKGFPEKETDRKGSSQETLDLYFLLNLYQKKLPDIWQSENDSREKQLHSTTKNTIWFLTKRQRKRSEEIT